MAKVKIYLEPGETQREAEESLYKALTYQNNGDSHNESFDDPAMNSVAEKMINIHSKIYQEMLLEIFEALDGDYLKNGNQ